MEKSLQLCPISISMPATFFLPLQGIYWDFILFDNPQGDLNFLGVILPGPKIQIHSRLNITRASPTPIYLWIHAMSGRKHLNSSASHGGHWAWAWWVSWGEVNDKTKGGRDHCCFLPPRLTMRPKKATGHRVTKTTCCEVRLTTAMMIKDKRKTRKSKRQQ